MQNENIEMATNDDSLLTLDEAVKFLDTSKSTFYRLLAQDDVKGVKVGKQWRFRKEDLLAYVNRSPVAAGVAPIARAELDAELTFFREAYVEAEGGEPEEPEGADSEARIGGLARYILKLAAAERASDVHIEAGPATLRVRFRIDGVLHDIRRLPMSLHESLVARLKSEADMLIAEKRLPQDGRFRMFESGTEYDVRVSLVPTAFGESLVLRLLDRSSVLIGLESLGASATELDLLRSRLRRYTGLIVVTGPSGSGKSTLHYASLQEVAMAEKKVLTAEDPIEYILPDITQIQMNRRHGVTFAAALRSMLRQDPDVLMCSEVRDKETAEIALQAALTGHLMLISLHADDTVGAVMRLAGMGIEAGTLGSAMNCVVATRLVRRLCPHCKQPAATEARAMLRAIGHAVQEAATLMEPAGCAKCHGTGYRGRLGIYEILVATPRLIADLLSAESEAEAQAIADAAGRRSLLAIGLDRAAEGEVSVDDVLRATGNWM